MLRINNCPPSGNFLDSVNIGTKQNPDNRYYGYQTDPDDPQMIIYKNIKIEFLCVTVGGVEKTYGYKRTFSASLPSMTNT